MTFRRLIGALCTSLVLAGIGASASAKNSATYADPTGDVSGDGAEVTAIDVSNDDVRQITWLISLPNRTQLLDAERVTLWLDLDSNPATGRTGTGAEMSVDAFGPTSGRSLQTTMVSRWLGDQESFTFGIPVFSEWDPNRRVLSLSVNQRFLEDSSTFRFAAESKRFDFRQGIVTGGDRAPDAGAFGYEIIGDRKPPVVEARPAAVKGGKPASLRYRVIDENPTSELITILRGDRRVARIVKKLRFQPQRNVTALWRVPKRFAPGKLRYCVVAEDESRNRSAPGCAEVRVR